MNRPGSVNGDEILCTSTEGLLLEMEQGSHSPKMTGEPTGMFWPVECVFSLPSLEDEFATKRLPTKRPAGQRSLDEPCEMSNSANLHESTANARDLESTSKELLLSSTNSSSTTGTELAGCPRGKSYDIGEALARKLLTLHLQLGADT